MNNTSIKNIINEVNTNKDIKWRIVKNDKTEITLTNSYDNAISYSIKVAKFEDDEYILVVNNHLGTTTAGFFPEDDYSTIDGGLALGIKTAVRNFNYVY